jgi:hypothetical protein
LAFAEGEIEPSLVAAKPQYKLKSLRTAALRRENWRLISKIRGIILPKCPPKRGAKPRARRQIVFGGVCWKKLELILNKIPTDCRASRGRTKTERSGGQKGKGLGGRNFCPPERSATSFFAAAIFRISLFEMRRQEVLPLSYPQHTQTMIRNST